MTRISDPSPVVDEKAGRTGRGRLTWYAVLVAVAAVVLLTGQLSGGVEDVEENGPTSQLPRGAQSTLVEAELPAFDTSGVQPVVVVVARDGGLTPEDLRWLASLEPTVLPWSSGPVEIREAPDRAAATLTFPIDTLLDDWPDGIDALRDLVPGAPEGLDAHVTGPAAGAYDTFSVFDGLNELLLLVSGLVVVLLLLLTYRSPILWLLPIVAIAVAMTVSQAVIYLLGTHAGLPVDGQSGGLLPILVFGVGTDYALLLIARYREQLHEHQDRHQAIASALRRAAPAVVASAATVVLSMLCLLLADQNSVRSLGAVGAIGIACAALAMLTVLPALLVVLGRWSFWPYVPHVGERDRAARRAERSERRWARVAQLVARHPRRTWVATAGALAALAVTVTGWDLSPDDAERFRDAPDSVVGQQVLGEHFPAGNAAPIEVVADAEAEAPVRAAIRSVPGIDAAGEPRPSIDGSRVLMSAVLTDAPDSAAASQTVRDLRDALGDVPGANALVGGWTAQRVDVGEAATRDALVVMPAVLAVVGLVLLLLLRSVVASATLVAIALLTYLAALGAHGLLMQAMGFSAVETSLPLLAFVLLVPLGVDYTIFLMSRVREEVAAHGHRDGVVRGLVATGGVITSAGIVLAATFGVAWTMPLTFMVGMGVVVTLGVLLDTFVVRSLLVPALAIDIGPRFWWPNQANRPGR
jgi:putative drug exporter of the RND superfamily